VYWVVGWHNTKKAHSVMPRLKGRPAGHGMPCQPVVGPCVDGR
jgi:hypothetical protein